MRADCNRVSIKDWLADPHLTTAVFNPFSAVGHEGKMTEIGVDGDTCDERAREAGGLTTSIGVDGISSVDWKVCRSDCPRHVVN